MTVCNETIKHWTQFLSACAEVFDKAPQPMGSFIAQLIKALPCIDEGLVRKSLEFDMKPALQALENLSIQTSIEPLLWYLPWEVKQRPKESKPDYAWVELVGLDGVQMSDDFRLGLYWQEVSSLYPRHRHNAEELYNVLAGEAEWQRGNEVIKRAPGSYFLHSSKQDHSTKTYNEQLLSLWAWQGDIGWESYSVDKAS